MPLDPPQSRSMERTSNTSNTTTSSIANTSSSSTSSSSRGLVKRAKSNKDLLAMYSREKTAAVAPPVPLLFAAPLGSSTTEVPNADRISATKADLKTSKEHRSNSRALRGSKSVASLRDSGSSKQTSLPSVRENRPHRGDETMKTPSLISDSSSLSTLERSLAKTSMSSISSRKKDRARGHGGDDYAFCLADLENARIDKKGHDQTQAKDGAGSKSFIW